LVERDNSLTALVSTLRQTTNPDLLNNDPQKME
jgi:hypothetical protein